MQKEVTTESVFIVQAESILLPMSLPTISFIRIHRHRVVTLDVDWNRHAYYYHFTDTTLTDGNINGHFTNYFPYFPDQEQLQSDQRRGMAQLKGVFVLPYEQRLSAGFEWRYDWLKAPLRVDGGKASDNTEALYVQDEWSGVKNLNVTAGLRLNRNEQFGFRLTPKLSAMYRLGEAWRLRGTWSQGFKTPTPKELYYRYVRQMSGTYLYLGNKDLTPQLSNYYSAGIEYTHHGWSITLTGYYNRVKDMIALVTIPNYQAPEDLYIQYQPIKTRQYKNLEDAKTYGVDVSARYTMREFTFGLNYSYLDTDANIYDTHHERMKQVVIDGMAHSVPSIISELASMGRCPPSVTISSMETERDTRFGDSTLPMSWLVRKT